MRVSFVAIVVLGLLVGAAARAREPERPTEEARARMQHHLREVNLLAQHFEQVLGHDCPRFASAGEWRAYLDGEVERVVLLLAHLEQAWVEAKRTGDDEVRRAAKAPRKRVDQARALLDKLSGCADGHGETLPHAELWRRIEREVPRRQTDVALPSDASSADLRRNP
jgi:hypothetical protein